MPEPRLKAGIWVAAYLARLRVEDIPAFVVRRGDETAGAVLVKCSTLDGRAQAFQRSFDPMTGARTWMVLAEGEEREVDEAIARRQLIPTGHPWEVEIRAATIWACELLRQRLAEQNRLYRATEIDWILWLAGQSLPAEMPTYHRTYTIFY